MTYQAVELSVCVSGKALHTYKDLDGDSFIEGRKGSEYILRLRNTTSNRVLAVVSVDGLSIMDGEKATPDSGGYILQPYQTLEVPGWSLGNESVAKFQFGSKSQSYAALGDTQDTSNVGTIGLAVWSEKPKVRPQVVHQYLNYAPRNDDYSPARAYWTSEPFLVGAPSSSYLSKSADNSNSGVLRGLGNLAVNCAMGASTISSQSIEAASYTPLSAQVNNVGTEFGEESTFKTSSSSFQREWVIQTSTLYYDDARGLKIRGIEVLKNPRTPTPKGNPFPGVGCKPPARWNR